MRIGRRGMGVKLRRGDGDNEIWMHLRLFVLGASIWVLKSMSYVDGMYVATCWGLPPMPALFFTFRIFNGLFLAHVSTSIDFFPTHIGRYMRAIALEIESIIGSVAFKWSLFLLMRRYNGHFLTVYASNGNRLLTSKTLSLL